MNFYDWSFTAEPIAELPRAPKPQLDPFAFQQAAAQQATSARPHTYCAHHPGAGKTPIALTVSMAYSLHEPVLVVCPPSICYQWAKQAYRWTGIPWLVAATTEDVRSFLARPEAHIPARFIVPDTLIHEIPDVPARFALLVADEAHRLKSADARRTRAFFGHGVERGLRQRADKVLCLSGTPMPNNPTELYPFLHACFPSLAPSFASFAARYCPPEKEWVWRGKRKAEIIVYKTAINKPELARKLRETAFIRPDKSVVHAQLPPMREERFMLKIGQKSGRTVQEVLLAFTGREPDPDKRVAMATERRELGEMKAHASLPYLETLIDGGDAPLIFTWHASAAKQLASDLKIPCICGDVSPSERAKAIDDFVERGAKAIVCTIGAAGTGIDGFQRRTDLAVFIERPYTPDQMEQAIGRLLRIGQRNATRVVIVECDHAYDHAIEALLSRKAEDIAEIVG